MSLDRDTIFREVAARLPAWHEPETKWPTLRDLAEWFHMSANSMRQRMDCMLRAGVIQRQRDGAHGGPFRYCLNEKGWRELRGG